MQQHDPYFQSEVVGLDLKKSQQFFKANNFPSINPVHWLHSHFAVGGYSPLRRLSGMLTAHMTQIKPHNGFAWHPHRGLEIYTYVIDGELYHEDITGGKGIIKAGEVQRMFSGNYIEHQELNISDEFTRVIQIWFVADIEHRGLPAEYEQVKLAQMPASTIGDAAVREIIGPSKATNSHVSARLTNTKVPAFGKTTISRPHNHENLFLYFVNGTGQIQSDSIADAVDLYDVLITTADAEEITITSNETPLNFLSFYLKPFIN